MGRSQNINRSFGEIDSNPHGWVWGVQDFIESVTADVVETARELELEVEPEDVNELLQSHDKTLKKEELFLTDDQRMWFLEVRSTPGKDAWKLLK